MAMSLWIVAALIITLALAVTSAPGLLWTAAIGLMLGALQLWVGVGGTLMITLWGVFVAGAALLLLPPVRRMLISTPLLGWFRKVLPQVSQTEQEALDAGTVWWDGELFSGKPNWQRLHAYPKPTLNAEERAFLDGPVEELCRHLNDWRVSHELNDLPPEVWQFIKDKGFLGMIIPKEYGGLGFSALAHSEVVMKLATRSSTACVSVMVPNSLGPAELLLHYGTDEQKRHYLPRLAKGLEMPCFALTGPDAGSDAGSIPDFGIVCRGMHEGREVLGMRVTWEKRYITLGPVSTLLGLAFRLLDPEKLLGGEEDVGITLALIPTSHPGVNIGRRHFPMNASFMNGPNSGKDVFIPMDWVIGGRERAGQGWRMLMECLAAGRSISLPSSSTGAAKLSTRTTGAYGRIRSQFKVPVGRFEGVEEATARIAGNTYVIEAARVMTAGAIDLGEKPSVISAIVKYHATERARQVINDAMDVHGGKGICLGPNNYLGRAYQQIPIGITVEGANILTRSMIIFGQGAIRCHPYVLKEIAATRETDTAKALVEFDGAFWGHVRFVVSNFARAFVHGITASVFAGGAGDAATARYYRQMTRLSAAFAFSSDVAMLVLGGTLKRREKLSARLGDILSQLYLASCVLKRYSDDCRPAADLPLVDWSVQDALARTEEAFAGLIENFPNRSVAWALRLAAFPLGRRLRPPSDALGSKLARIITEHSETRERLCGGMFVWKIEQDPVGRLEIALELAQSAEAIDAKLRAAHRDGAIRGNTDEERRAHALRQGVMTREESELLERYKRIQRDCIMVDDFPRDIGRNAVTSTETPRTVAETYELPRKSAA